MWVFNIFLWFLMALVPGITEDAYYQLWHWQGEGDPTGPHPDNPVR